MLHPLHVMSSRLPDNAKNGDFEKGKQTSPIPFVPIADEESDPNSHRVSYKLKTGVKTSIRSWTGLGSNESFVIHIKAVDAAVRGTGKWGELEEAEAALQAATTAFVAAKDAINSAEAELKEAADEDDEQLFKDALRDARTVKQAAKSTMAAAREEAQAKIADVFAFTGNFFTGDGHPLWLDIISKQTDSESWTNVRGEEKAGKRGLPRVYHPPPADPVRQRCC